MNAFEKWLEEVAKNDLHPTDKVGWASVARKHRELCQVAKSGIINITEERLQYEIEQARASEQDKAKAIQILAFEQGFAEGYKKAKEGRK